MTYRVTAQTHENDGGVTTVIQNEDQTVRLFVTTVFDGHRPGRVAGGIVKVLRDRDLLNKTFGGSLAGEVALRLSVGDEVEGYLASLAEKEYARP